MKRHTKKRINRRSFTRKRGGNNSNNNSNTNSNFSSQSAYYQHLAEMNQMSSNNNYSSNPNYNQNNNIENEVEDTELMKAVHYGTLEEAKELIQQANRREISSANKYSMNLLMLAALSEKDSLAKLKAILTRMDELTNIRNMSHKNRLQSYLDQTDDHGETALMIALLMNNTDTAKYLLDLGSDVNLINDNGETPLMIAIRSINDDNERLECVIQILLSFVKTIPSYMLNSRNKSNLPKVKERILKEVKEYINHDIQSDHYPNNALEAAIYTGNERLVKILLHLGARVYLDLVEITQIRQNIPESIRDMIYEKFHE